MRKRRSKLTGERHPTLDDPSPFAACGWCMDWIAEDDEPGFFPVKFDGPADGAPGDVICLDLERPTVALILPPELHERLGLDADAYVVVCSHECEAALAMALARDRARRNGEDVAEPVVTDDERHDAAELLKNYCAWCLEPIADDAPIETVAASLSGEGELDDEMLRVSIAGRKVHALVPPPGFPLPGIPVRDGRQVLFVLCSPACAVALMSAVHTDGGNLRLT